MQAALHLAHSQHPSLPRSSVLISPTRIVLLADIVRAPLPGEVVSRSGGRQGGSSGAEPERVGGEGGGESTETHSPPKAHKTGEEEEVDAELQAEMDAARKSRVLALQLMALGSRAPRTSQVLIAYADVCCRMLQGVC
jgi:hypothetical protein